MGWEEPTPKTSHWVGCWEKNLQECFNNINNMGPDPAKAHRLSGVCQGQAQGTQAQAGPGPGSDSPH